MKRILVLVLAVVSLAAGAAETALSLPILKGCPGCCSSHGGISSSCGSTGRILCNDGTTSPTCLCSSCGVSTPPPPTCSYTYSAWSTCQSNGTQTRVVTGSSPFGCTGSPGPLSESCTYVSPVAAMNYTAMWWNSAESGWGLNVSHQDSTIFATLFTYGTDDMPMWLVAPNLAAQPDGSFTEALYRVSGPAFNATPWTTVTVNQVGSMTLRFATDHTGTLTYTDGLTMVSKNIEKQIFSTPTACVGTTASRASLSNYQDMWWNANESGWGINLTHQGSIIFAVLFTYNATGRDLWLVGPDLNRQVDGSFAGSLYSTQGQCFSVRHGIHSPSR